MRITVSVIYFVFLAILPMRSQNTFYLSLDELLKQVEINYPLLLQYEEKSKEWKARADGAGAWMPPVFSAGVMRFPYDLMMLKEKNDPMNQAGLGFSFEQMIPNQSKLGLKRDYFNALSLVEKNKSDWTKNALRKEAKLAYYSRYIYEKKQRIVQESSGLLELILQSATAGFSNDQSQLLSIYKAKARAAELKNMELMLVGMIAESNVTMNALMVSKDDRKFWIDSLIAPKKYVGFSGDTAGLFLRNDIEVVSAYIRTMRIEQKLMKAGRKPDFGIRAEHMQMFGMPNQWTIMGMITVPIVPWSSKMYRSEFTATGFRIRSMEYEKQTMELMAKRMLLEKISLLNNEKAQYTNYETEILPAYEANLKINLLAYKQNTGDLFVVLDAWEMLLMKKMEMIDKLFNILKLEAEYEFEKEIK